MCPVYFFSLCEVSIYGVFCIFGKNMYFVQVCFV